MILSSHCQLHLLPLRLFRPAAVALWFQSFEFVVSDEGSPIFSVSRYYQPKKALKLYLFWIYYIISVFQYDFFFLISPEFSIHAKDCSSNFPRLPRKYNLTNNNTSLYHLLCLQHPINAKQSKQRVCLWFEVVHSSLLMHPTVHHNTN